MISLVTALASIIFVLVGIALAWAVSRIAGLNQSALLASLIFAPILAYVVLSGQVTEFKGFGLEAKFRELANSKVEVNSAKPVSADNVVEHGNASAEAATWQVILLSNSAINASDMADFVYDLAVEIRAALLNGTFQMLVIVDQNKRVLGYFDKNKFNDLWAITVEETEEELSKETIAELRNTLLWKIVKSPTAMLESWGSTNVIDQNESNKDAYRALSDKGAWVAVAVDKDGRYQGIVKREDILGKLTNKLLSQ